MRVGSEAQGGSTAIDASPSSYVRHRYVHAKRPLRRVALEWAVVVVAKIAFLMLIAWLLFEPHPKHGASADAVARQHAPAAQAPPKAQP
jgi:hypothetical protein